MRNKDIIRILGTSGADSDKSTRLKNLIEGPAVNYKILNYREST